MILILFGWRCQTCYCSSIFVDATFGLSTPFRYNSLPPWPSGYLQTSLSFTSFFMCSNLHGYEGKMQCSAGTSQSKRYMCCLDELVPEVIAGVLSICLKKANTAPCPKLWKSSLSNTTLPLDQPVC